MIDLRPERCPISGVRGAHRVFVYNAPSAVEVGFRRAAGEPYYREVWQFELSQHFVSRHAMNVQVAYSCDYVDATYGGEAGIARTFERIIALPPERSDNIGRIRRLLDFAASRFGNARALQVLDVGAGLGVFPYAVKQAGWNCVAIDPDPRAVYHMRERVGVTAICADFMKIAEIGSFDLITFNKVLEHVDDPIAMLKRAREFLATGGCVYIEVPDGEMAAREGSEREEFTVEHLHVFSFTSTAIMADRAGLSPLLVERVHEPSSKFTLRAFLSPVEGVTA